MVKELIKRKRRTPPAGPGVRQLHQRRLQRSGCGSAPARARLPTVPCAWPCWATAVLTVGTIFGAAIFHVLLVQSEFRLDHLNKEAAKEEALAFAAGALAKGGKVVITGLLGGTYSTPIAMFARFAYSPSRVR